MTKSVIAMANTLSLNVSILAVSLSVFAGPLPCVLMPE
jgi:hypothetical protein